MNRVLARLSVPMLAAALAACSERSSETPAAFAVAASLYVPVTVAKS